MKLYASLAGGSARRAILRGALAAGVLTALFAVSLLSPGLGEGAGTSVNGRIYSIRADYTELCKPGQIKSVSNFTAGFAINQANPKVIELESPGDIGGCLATQGAPGYLLFDDPTVGSDEELFGYSVIAAETSSSTSISAGSPGATNLTINVQDISGQDDWPGLFPPSGQIYVDGELLHYDSRTSSSFHIDQRGQNGSAPAHLPSALVRLQGSLKLVARQQRTYVAGPPTSAHDHNAPSGTPSPPQVRSPKIQLTCRARMFQTVQAGSDAVLSRSRCYARLEPDGPWPSGAVDLNAYRPAEYGNAPYPGPLVPLTAGFYHDLSTGLVNDTAKSTPLVLTTDYLGFQCLPYIEGRVWVKTSEDVNLPLGSGYGHFRLKAWLDDPNCTAGQEDYTIGATDQIDGQGAGVNARFQELAANTDTDGDKCSDLKELGDTPAVGGLRDPFNRWDYFDVAGPVPGYIDLANDILGVATKYQLHGFYPPSTPASPGYDINYDRGGTLGPSSWNLRPADKYIDLSNDILGVAFQYQTDCR